MRERKREGREGEERERGGGEGERGRRGREGEERGRGGGGRRGRKREGEEREFPLEGTVYMVRCTFSNVSRQTLVTFAKKSVNLSG